MQDWAFLARFCFISDRGVYEYEIEFDRRLGEPSMLLYFDEQDQWPAVYKSDKVNLLKSLSIILFLNRNMIVFFTELSSKAFGFERGR